MLRILALALLLLSLSGVVQSQRPPPKASDQKTEQEQRGTENLPFIVKVVKAEKSKDEFDREKAKYDSDTRLVEFTGDLALYTKLLFAATLALVVATAGLVVVGFRQIKDNRVAIKAATKSADATEKALTILERPYVFFGVEKNGMVVDMQSGNISPKGWLIYSFVNSGRTPAMLVEHAGRLAFCKSGKYPDIIDPSAKQSPPVRTTTFPAGVAISSGARYRQKENMTRAAIEEQDWYNFAESDWNLFITGYIRYADIFGGHHITGYCAMFNHIAETWVPMGDQRYNYTKTEKSGLSELT